MTPPIPNTNSNNNKSHDDEKNEVNLNAITLAAQVDVNGDDEDSAGSDDNGDIANHYDQNGQIAYQQLNVEEDADDNDFDPFEQLAQSRLTNHQVIK